MWSFLVVCIELVSVRHLGTQESWLRPVLFSPNWEYLKILSELSLGTLLFFFFFFFLPGESISVLFVFSRFNLNYEMGVKKIEV